MTSPTDALLRYHSHVYGPEVYVASHVQNRVTLLRTHAKLTQSTKIDIFSAGSMLKIARQILFSSYWFSTTVALRCEFLYILQNCSPCKVCPTWDQLRTSLFHPQTVIAWVVTPCSLVSRYIHSGEACCLRRQRLQGHSDPRPTKRRCPPARLYGVTAQKTKTWNCHSH
jgi:hypothetical protein